MTFGPVYNAQHSTPSTGSGVFSFGIGAAVLVYVWVRYFREAQDESKPPLGNLVWITLIACVFIGFGVWEIVKAAVQ